MSNLKKSGMLIVLALVCMLFGGSFTQTTKAAAASVEYQAHIENEG